MFCSKCGKILNNDARFCSYCGNPIAVTEDSVEEIKKQQEQVMYVSNVVPIEKKARKKATSGQIVFRCIWAIVWLFIVIGIIWCGLKINEQNKQREEARRLATIENTLIRLGNQSFGSVDYNTAQYSMALGTISDAALGESVLSNLQNADYEEVKEYSFESLERYFETDYAKTYAALLFGADYFEKEDIEFFYNGTKVNADQMKDDVEDIMFQSDIGLATLLVDKEDQIICMNLSLRIKMAEDGYISTEDIISDLYNFTYGGVGFKTVAEEKLAEGITYENLTRDIDEVFEGEKVYYEDLSPVGKMVFLYIMPRCVVQFDKEAGSELWNYYFMESYESMWNAIINRDIFKNVVEF